MIYIMIFTWCLFDVSTYFGQLQLRSILIISRHFTPVADVALNMVLSLRDKSEQGSFKTLCYSTSVCFFTAVQMVIYSIFSLFAWDYFFPFFFILLPFFFQPLLTEELASDQECLYFKAITFDLWLQLNEDRGSFLTAAKDWDERGGRPLSTFIYI